MAPGISRMRKIKCPVCAHEVPRAFIRRGTFPCPTCKEPLRIPRASRLLAVPLAACGYSLVFLTAYLLGLKGNALLIVTVFVGCAATFVVAAVMGLLQGYLFPRLERDPGFDDGEILHIVPPPGRSKSPQ
jgi:hypothetical protein